MSLFNSKNTLSIDFGTQEIKVIEGKYSKKGITVSNSFSIPVPKDLYDDGSIQDMDQLVYLLKQGLLNNKVVLGEAYGVVNSSKIIVREVIIPKVDDNQIASIIQYQLEDYIPVNAEEYVVNFLKLGNVMDEGTEKLNLLIIGVPKDIIESHLNLFKNIGIKPVVLDYAGNALRKLLKTSNQINNSIDISGSIGIIDLGYDSSAITIVKDGMIKVTRLTDVGSKYLVESLSYKYPDLTMEELHCKFRDISDIIDQNEVESDEFNMVEGIKSYINSALGNIDMIFRYYSAREVGNDIDLILLLGGMSNIEGMDKLFSNFFNKPTIRLVSLDSVSFDGELFRYANAIGGLVRLDEVK